MGRRHVVAKLSMSMVLAAAVCAPAAANPLKSRYTAIDLRTCTQTGRHPDGGTWRCPGLPGFPVYLAEGDMRQFLSFGDKPQARRAAEQTLAPFNTIFEAGRRRTTVEWRFRRQNGRDVPYATIVRYFTARDGQKGQVLVVAKVSAREACQVARIDALANADAIVLARQAADEVAPGFDCRSEPQVLGAQGRSPM